MNKNRNLLQSIIAVKPKESSSKIHLCVEQGTLCGRIMYPTWKELSPYYDNVEISCKTCLLYTGFSMPAELWWTKTAKHIAKKVRMVTNE